MKTADSKGSRVILANDPDADRLALAENDGQVLKTFICFVCNQSFVCSDEYAMSVFKLVNNQQ